VTGGMWALMSMGLALVFGVMNIPNFAHGEFFMIGTLVAYYLFTPMSKYLSQHPNGVLATVGPLFCIFVAMLGGAIVGALTEKLIFYQLRKRTREQWIMNSFLLTVGLAVVLINGHQLIFGTEFKGIVHYWNVRPFSFFGVYVSMERIVAFILAMVTITIFWVFMKFSRTGRAIRAVSQDEAGALMVGIDMNQIQTLTMALSCALAALAGASLLFMFPSYPTVGLVPLYVAWFVVIVVGLGNVAGAMVGGFIVALLQVLTAVYAGEGWGFVIPSALIIVILVFKPSGIFGGAVRGVLEQ
jgi:branched-chain amino acid transport system permease protein